MTATIINYCTNDYRYLKFCIDAAKKFSKRIIVPVCNHFFDGMPENRPLLHQSYRDHSDVLFVEFAYGELYGHYVPDEADLSHYWHSTARYVGFHFVENCDSVLFLDVDEIITEKPDLEEYDAVRLPSYFYFREPRYRAVDQFPLNGLLVRKEAITSPEMILDVFERKGLYDQIQGRKRIAPKPFVHHYSWVRTEEELKKKVQTWGHRHDQEWLKLIEREFSDPFTGTDRIHGFRYETVEPLHDVLKEITYTAGGDHFPHVVKVDRKNLFERGIEKLLK